MGKWHSADYFDFERIRELSRFSRIWPGDRVGTGVGVNFPLRAGFILLHFLCSETLEPQIPSNQSVFFKFRGCCYGGLLHGTVARLGFVKIFPNREKIPS